MKRIRLGIQTCLVMVLLFSVVRPAFGGWAPDIPGLASGQNPPEHPDYTLGESMPAGFEVIEQNLGPTGAHGKMWGWKQRTDAARQILITDVESNSPAAQKDGNKALHTEALDEGSRVCVLPIELFLDTVHFCFVMEAGTPFARSEQFMIVA